MIEKESLRTTHLEVLKSFLQILHKKDKHFYFHHTQYHLSTCNVSIAASFITTIILAFASFPILS